MLGVQPVKTLELLVATILSAQCDVVPRGLASAYHCRVIRGPSIAIATAVLATGCLGGAQADSHDAAQYRHYYKLGKRLCGYSPPASTTAIIDFLPAINVRKLAGKYPPKNRGAVAAGCRAAIPRQS
jgi:hypothetical protein